VQQGQKRHFCATPVSAVERPTLRILFGSQTGNATLLAEQLARQARDEKGWEVEVVDLHDFNAVRRYFLPSNYIFLQSKQEI
jgi:sulfite reductase alpha subunit-like flavoprotein